MCYVVNKLMEGEEVQRIRGEVSRADNELGYLYESLLCSRVIARLPTL